MSHQDWYPLTAGQQDFWEEFTLHPDQPVSTVAHCLELSGPVQPGPLADAIAKAVAESDTLSLRFCERDGAILQRPDPARQPALETRDLRAEPDPDAAARALMGADVGRVLDLRRDPLSAQMLLRVADDRWLWFSRGHHIILDGYGMFLIERRVARLYDAAVTGADPGPAFGRLAAFLAEETAYAASPACAQDRSYWQERFDAMAAPVPVLQKGSEDYGAPLLRHDFASAAVERDLHGAAAALGLNWGDTLTLVSALWFAGPDPAAGGGPVVVWLPFMSRMGSASARIPAMVVNILPLEVSRPAGKGLADAVLRHAAVLRRHRRHGRYRVEDMARDRGIPAGQRFHFTPLINVMPFGAPSFAGLSVRRRVIAAGPGDGFNLTFAAGPDGAGLSLGIEAEAGSSAARDFDSRARAFADWLGEALAALVPAGRRAPEPA